jgi:hypothetical protein
MHGLYIIKNVLFHVFLIYCAYGKLLNYLYHVILFFLSVFKLVLILFVDLDLD